MRAQFRRRARQRIKEYSNTQIGAHTLAICVCIYHLICEIIPADAAAVAAAVIAAPQYVSYVCTWTDVLHSTRRAGEARESHSVAHIIAATANKHSRICTLALLIPEHYTYTHTYAYCMCGGRTRLGVRNVHGHSTYLVLLSTAAATATAAASSESKYLRIAMR